jgi:hypothetical protein
MRNAIFAGMMTALAVSAAGAQPVEAPASRPMEPAASQPVVAPAIEQFLIEGKLAEGEAAMRAALAADPTDDQARYGLGVVQLIRAIERSTQQTMRFGIRTDAFPMMPGGRLPIPENPKPEQVTYAKLRQVGLDLVKDLDAVAETLGQIKDANVKLPLRVGLIQLDVDGDGDGEPLWHGMTLMEGAQGGGGDADWLDQYEQQALSGDMPPEARESMLADIKRMREQAEAGRAQREQAAAEGRKRAEQEAAEFVIGFDYADAQWLIGYTNLLSAVGEVALACDWRDLFDHAAHMIFPNVQTPYPYLKDYPKGEHFGFSMEMMVDWYVMGHLMNLPITEPKRLTRALEHFQAVTACSRRMWQAIDAETDDDHEWIPGSNQTGVLPSPRITGDMRKGWNTFLDEMDAILAGKLLVPHWRVRDGRGINIRRAFTEPPKRLDALLWLQGSAAAPYLEEGKLTEGDTWSRINELMGGQFGMFAAWWN